MPREDLRAMYHLDDLLTPEERAVRDGVRRFVAREVLPSVGRAFREGRFERAWVTPLAELGVLGANLSGFGCAGLGAVAYGLMLQELERADSGLRSFASVQSSLCMQAVFAFGSDAQRARLLPEMARGRVIGCFGLTEAEAGSDPAALRTRARSDGSDFVLSGSKHWITNGGIADIAVVWAKLDGDAPEQIRGFLVDTGAPGFQAREVAGKFSLRTSSTAELHLADVRVPGDALLPGAAGLKGPLSCIAQARAGIAFAVTGAAIACFEVVRDYCAERRSFGRPLAQKQLVQAKLADMLEAIVQAQLLGLRLLRLKEASAASPALVSLAKRANVKAALTMAREARALLGANGVTDDYPPIRHLLNLESVFTYEGTHEVHTLILGKAITGLDAFA